MPFFNATDFIPPAILVFFRYFCGITFKGNYADFKDVPQKLGRYQDSEIIEQIRVQTALVRDGKAAYVRDGKIFPKIEYCWPFLAALLKGSTSCGLNVCDFGGGLGSSYYQNRAMLKEISLQWYIVEQEKLVKIGQKEFESDELHFLYRLNELPVRPDVLYAGSVLQYLPDPQRIIREMTALQPDIIVVDRQHCRDCGRQGNRLCFQRVAPCLGGGGYPAWFFDEREFLQQFSGYEMTAEYDALGGNVWLRKPFEIAKFKGFIFERKKKSVNMPRKVEK